jgi:hypothetical protein
MRSEKENVKKNFSSLCIFPLKLLWRNEKQNEKFSAEKVFFFSFT